LVYNYWLLLLDHHRLLINDLGWLLDVNDLLLHDLLRCGLCDRGGGTFTSSLHDLIRNPVGREMNLADFVTLKHDIPPVINTLVGAESSHLALEVPDVVGVRHRVFIHEKEFDVIANVLDVDFEYFFPLGVETSVSDGLGLEFLVSCLDFDEGVLSSECLDIFAKSGLMHVDLQSS
jgi:hypothetical protein